MLLKRLIFWTFVFTIIAGLILHYHMDVPYVGDWLGKLPGDSVIIHNRNYVQLPIMSGFLSSVAFSFCLSFLRL